MKLKSMNDLFVHVLKDLHSTERQIAKMMPKIAKTAHGERLRDLCQQHQQESEKEIERIETIFEQLEISPRGPKSGVMECMVEEVKTIMEQEGPPEVRDAALICALQQIKHFEIASYGCARTFAQRLNQENAARLLDESLRDEKKDDSELTKIAEEEVNIEAMGASGP